VSNWDLLLALLAVWIMAGVALIVYGLTEGVIRTTAVPPSPIPPVADSPPPLNCIVDTPTCNTTPGHDC
jgi:hypothetical protein